MRFIPELTAQTGLSQGVNHAAPRLTITAIRCKRKIGASASHRLRTFRTSVLFVSTVNKSPKPTFEQFINAAIKLTKMHHSLSEQDFEFIKTVFGTKTQSSQPLQAIDRSAGIISDRGTLRADTLVAQHFDFSVLVQIHASIVG